MQTNWVKDQWDKNWLSLLSLGVGLVLIYANLSNDVQRNTDDIGELKVDRRQELELKVQIEGRLSTIEASQLAMEKAIERLDQASQQRSESEPFVSPNIAQAPTDEKESENETKSPVEEPVPQKQKGIIETIISQLFNGR